MPFDLDDPRLTAYALGEIDDPAEKAAVERLLAEHDDARRLIEEIRVMAALLTEQLHAESSPGLGSSRRKAIAGRLAGRPRLPLARLALAASLLTAVGTVIGVYQTRKPVPEPALAAAHPTAPAPAFAGEVADFNLHAGSGPEDPTLLAMNEGLGNKASDPSSILKDVARPDAGISGEKRNQSGSPAATPSLMAPEPLAKTDLPAAVAFDSERASGGSGRLASALARGLPEPAPGYVPPQPARRGLGIAEQPTREEIDAIALGEAAKPAATAAPIMTTRPIAPPQSGPVTGPAAGRPMLGMELQRRQSHDESLATRGAIQDESEKGRAAGAEIAAIPNGPRAAKPLPEVQLRQKTANQAESVRDRSDRFFGREAAPQNFTLVPAQQGIDKLAERGQQIDQSGKAVAATEARFYADVSKGKELVERKEAERLEQLSKLSAAVPSRPNREAFARIVDHPFARVLETPRSTFSIDVDTAAYALMRRYVMTQNLIPPRDSLRLEELVNAVRYDDPDPKEDEPFSVNVEIARCPWQAEHRLARIAIHGRSITAEKRPPGNLVFLVDASGSMAAADKLPLLKTGLRMLTEQLGEGDRVAIVAYSDTSRVVLGATPGDRKSEILSALDSLRAQGSTNGAEGLVTAYKIASEQFLPEGNNRVILATDGDFNVGITSVGDLERLITEKAKSKVFLTVLGFGTGNLQDDKLEALADKGDGQYHYIDSEREARKVLVEELSGTLLTVAKDVKVQVDFNPVQVGAYRQIGYENRALAARDFQDPVKDAGELGAGQTVTALYELVPAGKEDAIPAADAPRFVKPAAPADPSARESFIVKINSKTPEGNAAPMRTIPVVDAGRDYAEASPDFKFAAAIVSFGMLLRDSPFKGTATFDAILELAEASKGKDPTGQRAEFLAIVRKAKTLVAGQPR